MAKAYLRQNPVSSGPQLHPSANIGYCEASSCLSDLLRLSMLKLPFHLWTPLLFCRKLCCTSVVSVMDKRFHRVKQPCDICGIRGGSMRREVGLALSSHKLQWSLASRLLSSGTEDEIKFTSMCRFMVSSMEKEKDWKAISSDTVTLKCSCCVFSLN